ncbi:hypothetical protein HYT33_02690, partial [Candidatus Roizmanbacteria bacterium]|nr:hypothetical protein [Candidatus Roizmanbacteria bacterium]
MRDILRVVRYFSVFSYAPTPDDIYTFLSKKVSKRELEANLQNLTKKGVLKRVSLEIQGKKRAKYTLGEYGIKEAQMSNLKAQNYEMRYKTSQRKIAGVRFFIKMLSVFPQIKLVGFSGSCAMGNAKEDDDVDFFIISARGRMWTARFVANAIAFLLGIKRKRGIRKAKDKVCLNLIFDEEALEIPKFKHNEYVGHEVLQMKPIFNKNHI